MNIRALLGLERHSLRTEEFIEIRGMRLRVSIEGKGPPLLLINGIGANIEMWEPLRRLLRDRQTIAFDAPGAGASDQPAERLRMRDLADIVSELLDELGRTVVDVLGYSLGGAVAQQLAHQHPERVGRLVLAGTLPGMGSVQNPVTLMQLLTLPLRDRGATGHATALGRVVGGRTRRDVAALAAVEIAQQAHPPTRAGFARQVVGIMGWSSLPWLHTISAPTLALAGEQDPLVPPINNKIFTVLIPDCREHVVPGAGHLFLIDQPHDVVDVIEAFLSDGEPETGKSEAQTKAPSGARQHHRPPRHRPTRQGTAWPRRARAASNHTRDGVKRQARRLMAKAQ